MAGGRIIAEHRAISNQLERSKVINQIDGHMACGNRNGYTRGFVSHSPNMMVVLD